MSPSIWFIVMAFTFSDGSGDIQTYFPDSLESSTQIVCENMGKKLVDKELKKLEIKGIKANAYWRCESVTYDHIEDALTPKSK